MKRPKKEGNRHLFSAFTTETLCALQLKIGEGNSLERYPFQLLNEKLCKDKESKENGLEQIVALKQVGDHLQSCLNTDLDAKDISGLFNVLAFLFIKCRSKHPARRTIASILNGFPDPFVTQVISSLSKHLSLELDHTKNVEDGAEVQSVYRATVETLMAFTENFPLGKQVISNCDHQGLKFLLDLLLKEIPNARTSSSLEVQSNAMSNCLAALKATISVLHCKTSTGVEKYCSSNHSSDGPAIALYEILRLAIEILQDANFMLDCRSAAGIVIVASLEYLLSACILMFVMKMLLKNREELPAHRNFAKDLFCSEMMKQRNDGVFEEKIVQMILESVERKEYCTFSRLIVCHGLITKLDSIFLHSGANFATNISLRNTHCPRSRGEAGENGDGSSLTDSLKNPEMSAALDSVILTVDSSTVCKDESESREADSSLEGSKINDQDVSGLDEQRGSESLFAGLILNSLLSICATVNEKGMTVYAFRTLYCWTAEAFNHCKVLIADTETSRLALYSPKGETTSKLLYILNNYLDHPVDAVRHQVRNSLERIIKVINLFPDSESHVRSLLCNWLQGNLKVRSKCLSLICILDHIKVTRFLEIRETFPYDLLDCLNDSSLASHICDLYVKSAAVHKSQIGEGESELEYWVHVWCAPVFKAISSSDRLKRTYITDYVVPGLLKAFPGLVRLILRKSRNLESSQDYVVTTIVFLASARSLRECSKVNLNEDRIEGKEYWHGFARMEFMELCLCHIDEQVRLDCLALICESNKSTEILQQQDFELLKFFIPLNMTSQSPKFRSQFVCSLKKAVSRLTDRCKQAKKILHTETKREAGSNVSRTLTNDIADCKSFLKWLLEFLFTNLHTAACFPRVVTALEIMATVLKVLFQANPSPNAPTDLPADSNDLFYGIIRNIFSKDRIKTLVSCLYDTFDVNRSLANAILMMIPCEVFTFTDKEIVNMFQEGLTLAYSPQPDDSNAAPEIMKFLANGNMRDRVHVALSNHFELHDETTASGGCLYATHLVITKLLTEKLIEQVNVAEKGLSDAAFRAPLHGTIHCTRELLQTVEIRNTSDTRTWKRLIDKLIHLSFRIANVVGPVIQCSAPEGSLESVDHHVMVSQVLERADVAPKGVETQAHISQMLLVCCWRSMKETVLLLGDIVSCVPIYEELEKVGEDSSRTVPLDVRDSVGLSKCIDTVEGEISIIRKGVNDVVNSFSYGDQDGLSYRETSNPKKGVERRNSSAGILSSVEAINIGNVFIEILLSSRHIGAFELAYLGFVKVCETFWRSKLDSLKVLPRKWINDLLGTLKSDDLSTVLCATRRSAGIPFYISAICSTEPVINKRKTFHGAMTVLVEVCRTVSNEAGNSESTKNDIITQKVISLNILRAMFRDSKFGEDVFPYASDGLVIAIKGFSSSEWAIRNACTLLFSALMTRVFGVKKFPMSGTEFFSRFSTFYSFLKTEMEEVSNQFLIRNFEVHLHPSVFPLLLLLSHLYPSSMDGNDSKMKLSTFVPHIIRCGNSGVYKTRSMAATALASIVTAGELVGTTESLISSLPKESNQKDINHNRINGTLLQIQRLLQGKIAENTVSPSLKKKIVIGPLISLTNHLWLVSRANSCSFNKALFFDVVNESLMELNEKDWNSLTNEERKSLMQVKDSCFKTACQELEFACSSRVEIFTVESLKRRVGHELLRKSASEFVQKYLKSETHKFAVQDVSDSRLEKLALILAALKSEFSDVRESFCKWLCSNAKFELQEREITVCLQERLLEGEKEDECLAAICNALVESPYSKTFPWTLASGESYGSVQVWERFKLKFKLAEKKESFRSAAQRLTLVLVSQLHGEIRKTEGVARSQSLRCIEEMFDFVRQSCHAEESFISRIEAAKVIGNKVYLDLVTDRTSIDLHCFEFVLQYWKCVVDLIQDEDADIRYLIASNVFPFVKEVHTQRDQPAFVRCPRLPTGFCLQPSYVLQVIIRSLCEFYSDFPWKMCNFLMSIIVGKSEKAVSEITESRSIDELLEVRRLSSCNKEEYAKIFEESEANMYKEELTLGHIAFEELQYQICLKNLGPEALNRGFSLYIWSAIKEFQNNPNLFFAQSHLRTSCQIVMGLCILLALGKNQAYSEIKDDFVLFCVKVDELVADGLTIDSCILIDHFQCARWMCG